MIARESARPFYAELCRAIWRAGGHVLGDYRPDDSPQLNLMRDFFELAGHEQHAFFHDHPDPKARWREVARGLDTCSQALDTLPIDRRTCAARTSISGP